MACFEDEEVENLDACINTEVQAGVSEVGVHYAIHEQITTFPMPKKRGDVGYNYTSAVTVSDPLVFQATKGFGKINIMPDSGEVKIDLVGNKGNKKPKVSLGFSVAGNDAKALGFWRTHANTPMVFCVPERDGQKRLIGDKFNPAYVVEAPGTTGKGGEDDKIINFTLEAYSVPIVYTGTIQLPA